MRKSSIWISSLLCIVLLSMVFMTGCGSKPEDQADKKMRIAFVTYMAIDQAEWLQLLSEGLNEYQKNHPELDIKIVEATQPSEYEPKIRALAEANYDVIITTYDNMAQATIAVANDFPEVKFGSMDGAISNLESYKNIQEFRLSRVETAYVAGIVAGKMTDKNKVGIIAGADVGPINEIIAGWQQGLRAANPNIEDIVVYSNSFTDPTKGKELGSALLGKGCDIIGAAAGGTGVGAAQAAASSNAYFVAWDVHYPEVLGDLELGSAVNFFDIMVIQFIDDIRNGKYNPGTNTVYGLLEGACDFEWLDNSPISEEAKADAEAAIVAIGKGEIEILTEPLHK